MILEKDAQDFNKNIMIKDIASIRKIKNRVSSFQSNLLVLVLLRREFTYS